MKLIRNLDDLPEAFRRGAVAIGNFDGVHRGHAQIVARLVSTARELGGPAIVFTFDPHPARVLRPDEAPQPLCWTGRKAELLGRLGADAVIAFPTDEAFLQLTAWEFFDRIVRRRLDARALVEGSNFFFGHHRQGDVALLKEFCLQTRIRLEVMEPLRVDGQIVSSSRVRRLLAAGQIDQASKLLTGRYRIRGPVVRGAERGRKLGFPTANLGSSETLLPGEGIYAGLAAVDGDRWPAAISVGPNPTFGEGVLKIEAYLLDYSGSLYGRHIEIDFLARLRDVVRFDSVEELLVQMAQDVEATRRIVAGERG
jgi:riboflavin kinase/FMN adenylyltransferase